VLQDSALIQEKYLHLDNSVRCIFHIRRAGDVSGNALGTFMAKQVKRAGRRGVPKFLSGAHGKIRHFVRPRTTHLDDPSLVWMAKELPGNVHCRPDGTKNIKVGWAFESDPSDPEFQFHNHLNPHFPRLQYVELPDCNRRSNHITIVFHAKACHNMVVGIP